MKGLRQNSYSRGRLKRVSLKFLVTGMMNEITRLSGIDVAEGNRNLYQSIGTHVRSCLAIMMNVPSLRVQDILRELAGECF